MQPAGKLLLFTTIAILLAILFHQVFYSASNDFSTRFYGSRLMQAGEPAYFNQPGKTLPPSLNNPYGRAGEWVNGNTATPFTLQLFSWTASLPFDRAIQFWWILSWLFLFTVFGCIVYTWRREKIPLAFQWLPLLFIATAAWRMHLYSGQIYVFFALLMVLVFGALKEEKWVGAGLIAAVLVLCRPPALILVLPLLLVRGARRFRISWLVSLLCLGAASVLLSGTGYWEEYIKALGFYAKELTEGRLAFDPAALPVQSDAVLLPANPAYIADADIFSLQKLLVQWHLPTETWILYAAFGFLFLGVLMMGYRVNKRMLPWSLQTAFFLGFTGYMLLEYCAPAPRFTYNFMQWMLPFSMLVFVHHAQLRVSFFLALAGLLMNIFKLPMPEGYSMGEAMMLIAWLLSFLPRYNPVILDIYKISKRKPQTPNGSV
jgi:hypothetical protein